MVEKLNLAFPMLSDPDRAQAITPYGLTDHSDPRGLARPALAAAAPGGNEVYRFVSRDYADRLPEDELISVLFSQGLPPAAQPRPAPGTPQPGPQAMSIRSMIPYFRGGRFAALALGMRRRYLGEAFKADTKAYVAEMDRYAEAIKKLRSH